MMPERESAVGSRELSSWKQIADHLGVSIRTAQALEKERGLPVHRLTGVRGRVTTTVGALNAWKQELNAGPATGCDRGGAPMLDLPDVPKRLKSAAGVGTPALMGPVGRASRAVRVWPAAVTLVVAVALFGGAGLVHRMPHPYSSRIDHDAVVVFDEQGRELWRKHFGFALHATGYIQRPASLLWVGDLDGDGDNEVLVVAIPAEHEHESHSLWCFSHTGQKRWRFTQQRRVATSTTTFSPTYAISGFVIIPSTQDKPTRILVANGHDPCYPGALVLLAPNGQLLDEYWHPGHLSVLRIADRDGKPEIYAAGINNAWHTATLVVLDPNHLGGAAQEPQTPTYQFIGMPPAHEKRRITFPRSCLNQSVDPFSAVADMWLTDDDINVETNERITSGAGIVHSFNVSVS
jgi:hypothetical protein